MAAPPTGTALPEDGINFKELSPGSSEEEARKSTFDLNAIDEVLLKQVVKKFTAISGGRFYRSCRGAKMLVEWSKPLWTVPGTRLYISGENINAWRIVTETDEFGLSVRINKETANPKIPHEFCRIEEVIVIGCGTAKLKQFALPALEALKIDRLRTHRMPEEDVLMVLRTAKYRALSLWDSEYDPNCHLFKDCKHIYIHVCGPHFYTWTAEKLFELLRERKTVHLSCNNFYMSLVTMLIENWLMGKSTGTLEELAFYLHEGRLRSEDMDSVLNQADIRNLTKSCLKTRDGYVLQGKGLGLLRIALRIDARMGNTYPFDSIHFHFE